MKTLLRVLLTILPMVAAIGDLAAQPPKGSQLPEDENNCAACHGDSGLWEGDTLRLYVPKESLAKDVHLKHGVNCHDCHGGDPRTFDAPEAHATEVDEAQTGILPFRDPLGEVKKSCIHCHKEQWNDLKKDGVHAKVGEKNEDGSATPLGCNKCHGVLEDGKFLEKVHGMLSVRDEESPVFLDHQVQTCGGCHEEHMKSYEDSVHGFGLRESGLVVTASCADCHGAHGIFGAADERSTLHTAKVATTCGQCHRFIAERLQQSVHARDDDAVKALSGLLKASAASEASLEEAKALAKRLRGVPGTEKFVEEAKVVASHLEKAPGTRGLLDEAMRGRMEKLLESLSGRPSCTACHKRHDLPHPKSARFRVQLPHRCGNCHAEQSNHYEMSVHGELTELGYGPGAKCSDCHGAHDILPICQPGSRLSAANRMQTCASCHPYAVSNFLDFDPHADHTDPAECPLLYWVYVVLITFILSVFGFFGLHSVLWFVRSLIDVLRNGRPKALTPGALAYVRFGPFHRAAHTVLFVSFLGLALTGLPLKYSQHEWAKTLAFFLGGFDSTRIWHRIFGLVNIGCLAVYILRMSRHLIAGLKKGATARSLVFGPDSPVPNLRDVADFFKMVRWFLGLGPKPTFERWSYWEKFDFWGAIADIVIIGLTGLILWFDELFCTFLPGETLNVAKVIHSTQALLATGFVFAIHFFNTHLRPEKFPMDLSVLTGLVSEEELREERPEYLQRLRKRRREQMKAAGLQDETPAYFERIREEGKLDEIRGVVPSRKGLALSMFWGSIALLVGLSLLVGIVLASLGG